MIGIEEQAAFQGAIADVLSVRCEQEQAGALKHRPRVAQLGVVTGIDHGVWPKDRADVVQIARHARQHRRSRIIDDSHRGCFGDWPVASLLE